MGGREGEESREKGREDFVEHDISILEVCVPKQVFDSRSEIGGKEVGTGDGSC